MTRRDPRDRRAALWLFLTLSSVYLVTSGGHFYTGDGIEMFKTAESLVLRGDLALLPGVTGREWGYVGADGRRYTPYALGLSLVEAAFFAPAHALTPLLPLGDTARARLEQAAVMSSQCFITAATAVLLFLLARDLGFRRRAAGATALLYGLGTMAWVYSKHDFAEPLAGLCLLGAVRWLHLADRGGGAGRLAIAGAFNGFTFFTKYQMVLYTPFLLAFLVSGARRRRESPSRALLLTAVFLAPGLLFGLANLAVNHARFGTWLETGYANQGEIVAGLGFLPVGLFGLILSPGKGLLWYSPLAAAAPFAWREFHARDRRFSLLASGLVAATILMFAPLWWWHGDWSWGPRYLIVALPFLVLPLAVWLEAEGRLAAAVAGRIRLRHVLAVLLAAALLVNALGLLVDFFAYIQALRTLGFVHDDWNFIPGLSPLRFHAHAVAGWIGSAFGGTVPHFTYRTWCDGALEDHVIPMDSIARTGREPDLFFFRRRDTAIEQYGLGLAGALLLASAVVGGIRLRGRLAAEGP